MLSVVPDTRVVPGLGESRQFSATQRHGYQASLDDVVKSAPAGRPATGRLLPGPVVDALAELSLDEYDLLVSARGATDRCAGCCSAASPRASYATPRCPWWSRRAGSEPASRE